MAELGVRKLYCHDAKLRWCGACILRFAKRQYVFLVLQTNAKICTNKTRMNPFFKISKNGNVPEVLINGIIGKDADFSAFRDAVKSVIDKGGKSIRLVINSGGGSMTEGFAMYDMLVSSGLIVEVEILGMAASMGGILALAASPGRLGIYSNASVMTHRAQAGASGESSALRSMADYADKLEQRAKEIICKRTGKTAEQIAEWFKPGEMRWFNAEEAVAAGLADYIIQAPGKAKPTNLSSDMEVWNFYEKSKNQKNIQMEKTIGILNQHKVVNSLTDESTDEQVSAVIDNALKAKDARIAELETQLDTNKKDKATALVDMAVKAGKIKADDKEKFVKMASSNYHEVKEMFDALTGRIDPKMVIVDGGGSGTGASAPNKKFSEHTEPELRAMKTNDLEGYKNLFKAEYGVEYEGN